MKKLLLTLSILLLAVSFCWAQSDEEQAFKYAVDLYQGGQYDMAKSSFLEFLGAYGGSDRIPEVYLYLAKLENNPDVAVQYYNKIVNEYPMGSSADKALFGIAQYHYATADYRKAAETYQKLINDYPKSELCSDASYWSANSYFLAGELDRAEEAFNRTIMTYPRSEKSAWALFDVANLYQQKQDCPTAIQKYEQMIEQFPESNVLSAAYYHYAECLQTLGRNQESLNTFKYVLDNFPQSIEAAMVRGKDLTFQASETKRIEPTGAGETPVAEARDVTPAAQPLSQPPAAASAPSGNLASEKAPIRPAASSSVSTKPTGGKFYIQIGAYSNADNAQLLKSSIEDQNYPVTIVQAEVGGKILYRVWIGGFATSVDADQFAKNMVKEKGIRNYIVVTDKSE